MSYFRAWVRPWNLAQDVIPVAVIRPTSAQEVAAVVNCGAQHNVKVQARSGGHSYA
jgi:FAD/FMN-containing dehydrogenase